MNVSTAHAKLLEEWVADLRRVMPELQDWWDQMVRDAGPGGDRIVRARWPSGPASHPRVIGLFRDYYFRVEALNHTLGERQSQGRAMQNALEVASSAEGYGESAVEFVVSNFNGERYGALEALIFRARFYRTHREYMATAYPAMSFGDTGSASAALALAVAADAFGKGYAPGRCAMLEIASEEGLRAAACLTGGPG